MLCDSRKIHRLTREFHVKFHLKNRYRTHRFAIRAISVFRVKVNVEFPRQVVNFPIIFTLRDVSKSSKNDTKNDVFLSAGYRPEVVGVHLE